MVRHPTIAYTCPALPVRRIHHTRCMLWCRCPSFLLDPTRTSGATYTRHQLPHCTRIRWDLFPSRQDLSQDFSGEPIRVQGHPRSPHRHSHGHVLPWCRNGTLGATIVFPNSDDSDNARCSKGPGNCQSGVGCTAGCYGVVGATYRNAQ